MCHAWREKKQKKKQERYLSAALLLRLFPEAGSGPGVCGGGVMGLISHQEYVEVGALLREGRQQRSALTCHVKG